MRYFLSFLALWIVFSCSSTPEKRPVNRPNKDFHDWTGTYEFKDSNNIHTLKLHRRAVDLSYEMTYVTSTSASKNNIWSLKDFDDSVRIVFINNFVDDPSSVPFTRGDILFSLHLQSDSSIVTSWQKVQPQQKGTFVKVSNDYH